ncbi:unnamed protein product [Brassica oleracea]|uniref:(rape) hypothetical protein n=1 Tax=Brassica napus TaxID=3708 RepID=A0A816J593_BRANA|nr:unnamed protein product [Brassica napus]
MLLACYERPHCYEIPKVSLSLSLSLSLSGFSNFICDLAFYFRLIQSSIWFSFFNSPSRFQLPKHHSSRDDASSDPRDIESVKKKLYLAWKPSSASSFLLVRPAVETVFENLLLQLLLAKKIPSIRKFHLAEGLNVDGVLESWGKIKPVSWKLGMKKLEMIGLKRT